MSILFNAVQEMAQKVADGVQICDGEYGVIVSTDPISIRLTNETIIPSQFITVCQHLTDHDFSFEFIQNEETNEKNEITQIKETNGFYVMCEGAKNPVLIDAGTETEPEKPAEPEEIETLTNTEESEPPKEPSEPKEAEGGTFKDFVGKGTIKIKNKLKINDRVLLLCFSSGQNYVVIDRLEQTK